MQHNMAFEWDAAEARCPSTLRWVAQESHQQQSESLRSRCNPLCHAGMGGLVQQPQAAGADRQHPACGV